MWEERVRINGILEVPNNFPVESFQPWERERDRDKERSKMIFKVQILISQQWDYKNKRKNKIRRFLFVGANVVNAMLNL